MLAASLAVTQVADSIDAVTITAEKGMVVSMTDTIRISGGDISEALQILPSLYVNDYGDLSGLRSVSMRGLGSTHTAIFIDGIRVNNLQTGQADLGMTEADLDSVIERAQTLREWTCVPEGVTVTPESFRAAILKADAFGRSLG